MIKRIHGYLLTIGYSGTYIAVVIHFAALVFGECQLLYNHSWRVLMRRCKYRACVYALRARTTLQTRPVSFPVLNRCGSHLRESTLAYMRESGCEQLVQRIDFSQWARDALHGFCAPRMLKAGTKLRRIPILTRSLKPFLLSKRMPFSWPIVPCNFWLSSLFGPRKRQDGSPGFHTGIDLAASKGTPVRAPRSGVVLQACYAGGYGKMIVIQHGKKFRTRYAHLDEMCVVPGDFVSKSRIIGKVGDTGFTRKEGRDGSHLHFELYEYEKSVDPMQFLPKLV